MGRRGRPRIAARGGDASANAALMMRTLAARVKRFGVGNFTLPRDIDEALRKARGEARAWAATMRSEPVDCDETARRRKAPRLA